MNYLDPDKPFGPQLRTIAITKIKNWKLPTIYDDQAYAMLKARYGEINRLYLDLREIESLMPNRHKAKQRLYDLTRNTKDLKTYGGFIFLLSQILSNDKECSQKNLDLLQLAIPSIIDELMAISQRNT